MRVNKGLWYTVYVFSWVALCKIHVTYAVIRRIHKYIYNCELNIKRNEWNRSYIILSPIQINICGLPTPLLHFVYYYRVDSIIIILYLSKWHVGSYCPLAPPPPCRICVSLLGWGERHPIRWQATLSTAWRGDTRLWDVSWVDLSLLSCWVFFCGNCLSSPLNWLRTGN